LFVETCEDVWTPIPPSTYGTMAGATILANHSASNITIGKADYRRNLCMNQSGRCLAAYLYSAAGPGESTTDVAWDGQALICENGELLAESKRFSDRSEMIIADIDIGRMLRERMRQGSFHDSAIDCRERIQRMRRVRFDFQIPEGDIPLQREVARFPYVPSDPKTLEERCFETYNIQVHGLKQRLSASGIYRLVIGVSGGLDSTQALIVAAKTMDLIGLSRANILAYTLPGFGTSDLTHQNAWKLMRALRVTAEEIDIKSSCMQMFRDIGHPYAQKQEIYDATFANVQAGERTSKLFRLANHHNALVLGTGDLSELAQGWTTYGVGDHMSHYNVNTSLPKTLIQHVIRWVINSAQFDQTTNEVLKSVLLTEISPELIPGKSGDNAQPAQKTADKIGPFELQDFNLYYLTRFGFTPIKIAFLSHHAWGDSTRGTWPPLMAKEDQKEYSLSTIKHWLTAFLDRFFRHQFKRSVAVNGPKVGSGGSLSPRGDWRAPSDAPAFTWLEEVKHVPEDDKKSDK
jgi:NAD+ synthase (glutamine-hydrolysing)